MRVDISAPGRLDLGAALQLLAARGITRLLVEGGPTVGAAMITKNLVDEVALFRASTMIGPDGIDALEGMPISALTGSQRQNIDYLLENIVDPSRTVQPAFRVSTLVLDDGRVLNGIVSSAGERNEVEPVSAGSSGDPLVGAEGVIDPSDR